MADYTLVILALVCQLSLPTELTTMFEEAVTVYRQACLLPETCNTNVIEPLALLSSERNLSDPKYSSEC